MMNRVLATVMLLCVAGGGMAFGAFGLGPASPLMARPPKRTPSLP
jgi:hypothetical protein